MATDKNFKMYIEEQLSLLDEITFRMMMGEYIIYYKEKIIAYLCDDRLLIKPTATAGKLLPDAPLEPPYDGARGMLLVEETDNKEFLAKLFCAVEKDLPAPKPKK